jgi:hypothetical protein
MRAGLVYVFDRAISCNPKSYRQEWGQKTIINRLPLKAKFAHVPDPRNSEFYQIVCH